MEKESSFQRSVFSPSVITKDKDSQVLDQSQLLDQSDSQLYEKEGDSFIWAKVDELFEKLDKNEDGQIDINIVKPYVKSWIDEELGIEGGETIIEEAFRDVSKNGNLRISKQEMFDHL